jgi:UDP-MurNAc hydroxylase
MKFEFIGNASGIFYGDKGTKILCDPWLVDGVFEGSWCHYPPLKTKFSDVENVDAIYVSHLHPDHFDERYFDFAKDIPLLVLDHGPAFLIKNLEKMGYNNLIKIKDGQTVSFREFKITLFAPFAKHNFHEAEVGNLIDSALVIENAGKVALNANDNTPTVESCKMLKDVFGHIDLAMINYNAAGPYPACFNNLSLDEKKSEHNRILQRNFDHFYKLLLELKPSFALPFAGAYILGGKLHDKNDYLGTTTWDECANFLRSKNIAETEVICLREKDVFDLVSGKSNQEYVPIDANHMKDYIEKLSAIKYPYESDESPDLPLLKSDLKLAASRMISRMGRFGIKPKMKIEILVGDEEIEIYPGQKEGGSLKCQLDSRLLRRILNRQAHWNNSEIGCHIEFVRVPNKYDPDLHTCLQFLHL